MKYCYGEVLTPNTSLVLGKMLRQKSSDLFSVPFPVHFPMSNKSDKGNVSPD